MKTIISACIAIVFFASCAKEGTGGDATVVAFLKHHDKVIPSSAWHLDTVFVKFNAKELPGTKASDFDTFFVGEAGEDHVHCTGLKPGDYFLYGVGFDTTISMRIAGGLAVKIKHKERKDEIDVNVPVTE